mmetsp:Transcript_16153/g.25038  ORF Transcript_16153/g.25038 Transcript_16153/m.25038 type:complete len:231 (+) Transcript_16153:295-987(+)
MNFDEQQGGWLQLLFVPQLVLEIVDLVPESGVVQVCHTGSGLVLQTKTTVHHFHLEKGHCAVVGKMPRAVYVNVKEVLFCVCWGLLCVVMIVWNKLLGVYRIRNGRSPACIPGSTALAPGRTSCRISGGLVRRFRFYIYVIDRLELPLLAASIAEILRLDQGLGRHAIQDRKANLFISDFVVLFGVVVHRRVGDLQLMETVVQLAVLLVAEVEHGKGDGRLPFKDLEDES